ncbi:hypothetical protein BKA69DRAFT_17888 [Paraphysoderma sedebokerense]|nr:hypothetical protein BKA69DRAFT_17888 [Paraphysoderma sedebokerense]
MGIIRWQFAVIISLLLQGAGIYATNVISTGGSSFAAPLYKQLMTSYNSLPKWDNFLYSAIEVATAVLGRTMLLNKTYIFAGTDNGWTIPQTSQSMRDNVMMIPSVAGAVVVVYNLPQLRDVPYFLNLSREATADIFLGRIVTWNDAVLQALNPSVQLPNETIRVVVRRDQSGTTEKFTSALSKFSQDFASQIGRSSLPKWNKQDYNVSGNGGVARAVAGFEYAIGYVDIAVSKENDVQYATMINKRGMYVRGSYESLEATLRNLPQSAVTSVGNLTEDVDLADLDGDASYPLAGLTYYVLNRTVDPENCDTMRHAARYLHWKYTSSIAVDIAHTYEFAVISGPILERTIQLLQTVQCETATNAKVALWGQSVCDTGCKNGKCRYTYGFQPSSEICSCDLGYKNQKSNDCSEEIIPTTMEMTDPGVAVIVVLSSALLFLTVVVIAVIVYHRHHKIIKGMEILAKQCHHALIFTSTYFSCVPSFLRSFGKLSKVLT